MSLIAVGEIPVEIRERLAAIDPRLHIRRKHMLYVDQSAAGAQVGDNGPNDHKHSAVWCVCMTWLPTDPRRQMIQRGELSPDSDFDLVAMMPADCPLDQVPGYLVANLNSAAPRKIANAAAAWNRDQQIRNGQGVEDFMDEELDKVTTKLTTRVAVPRGKKP